MLIEFISGKANDRVLVTMEAAELDGYGVTFSAMSLHDPSTQAMLRDLLSMVTRMGLREEGEQVQVDCARTGEGGCALLISRVHGEEYSFSTSDDVIAAYLAGGLSCGRIRQRGENWTFSPCQPADERQKRILSEFCEHIPQENNPQG